jgi:hypothetical protein
MIDISHLKYLVVSWTGNSVFIDEGRVVLRGCKLGSNVVTPQIMNCKTLFAMKQLNRTN